MKKIYSYLYSTLKNNKHIIKFLLVVFFFGIVFGSLFLNFISDNDKIVLTNNISDFFNNVNKLNKYVLGLDVFKDNLINSLFISTLIFILGLSIIGIVIVIFIIFYKGFATGLSISSIILKYKFKGILGAFLYVFPFNIIEILIFIFLSLYSVNSSLKFIRAIVKKDNLNFKTFIGKYLLSFIISIFMLTITSLCKAYILPFMLKLFTYLIY